MDKMIGFKIRKVREIKDITQSFVANKLSLSQSTYSDIENGKSVVTSKMLEQIATILKVTPEVIEGFSDTVVFNSCTQSGYINTNNINPLEKIDQLYNEIIEGLKNQVITLKETIVAKDKVIALLEGHKK